jgi:4-aminobutyrate aminotransferase-like enzyme
MAPRLRSWIERFPIVGNAATSGLMAGVELVEPGTTRPLRKPLTRRLFRELMDRGVLAMAYDSRIRIYPPLTVPEDQLEEGLEAFELAMRVVCELVD